MKTFPSLRRLATLCTICVLPHLEAVPNILQEQTISFSATPLLGIYAGTSYFTAPVQKWALPERLGSIQVELVWSWAALATEINPGLIPPGPLSYNSTIASLTTAYISSAPPGIPQQFAGAVFSGPTVYNYALGENIVLLPGESHVTLGTVSAKQSFVVTDQALLDAMSGTDLGSFHFSEFYSAQSKYGSFMANGSATIKLTFGVPDTANPILLLVCALGLTFMLHRSCSVNARKTTSP